MDCTYQCSSKNERTFLQPDLCMDLKLAGVDINRKMLAEMAVNDAAGFAALAEVAKTSSSLIEIISKRANG